MIGPAEVEAAAGRLRGVLRPTPVTSSRTLSELAGRPVLLKPEHLQRTGSFKIRGAYNRVAGLSAGTEVVAASAGNHAQGVALAASLCGMAATVFMPAGCALPKLEATRSYGAAVQVGGAGIEECIAAAEAYAAETGAVYVPPFDDPDVMAGQATVGLELAAEAPGAEVVVVPVGGGGLVGGVAAALDHWAPAVKVVGVQAAAVPAMRAALAAGHPVTVPGASTLADGIAVRRVSELTLDHARAYVDEVVEVGDEEITRALLLLVERCKWVVEPAGAAGLAAVLAGRVPGDGPVAVVLSGGNVDPLLLIRLLDHGLSAAGRYLRLRVALADHPGALAGLAAALAELGLNILDVSHHRSGVTMAPEQVEVQVTLETRDPAHREDTVEELRRRGFRVEAF